MEPTLLLWKNYCDSMNQAEATSTMSIAPQPIGRMAERMQDSTGHFNYYANNNNNNMSNQKNEYDDAFDVLIDQLHPMLDDTFGSPLDPTPIVYATPAVASANVEPLKVADNEPYQGLGGEDNTSLFESLTSLFNNPMYETPSNSTRLRTDPIQDDFSNPPPTKKQRTTDFPYSSSNTNYTPPQPLTQLHHSLKRDDPKKPSVACVLKNQVNDVPPQEVVARGSASASSQDITPSVDDCPVRFRGYQADLWSQRFEELLNFKHRFGHTLVPHTFQENTSLIQWVKRQRHQYKLKHENRHSTLTQSREDQLNELGFVWDSHEAAWEERFNDLLDFKQHYGHCNVPTIFPENPPLSIWVKCQRRQFKLFWMNKKSHITRERIGRLADVGFVWNPRQNKVTRKAGPANNNNNLAV